MSLLPGERIGIDPSAAKVGDPVMWTRQPRGGWGYYEHIPATVVRIGKKRITIEVATVSGVRKTTSVMPVSRTPRAPEGR